MDCKGPDQTVNAQVGLGFYCPHMPEGMFSHSKAHLVKKKLLHQSMAMHFRFLYKMYMVP